MVQVAGVQVPLAFWQLLLVVWLDFEQVPVARHAFWFHQPDLLHLPLVAPLSASQSVQSIQFAVYTSTY